MRGETRRNVRINIKEGHVHVFHSAMPALRCRLVDFSEGGARCVSQTAELDAFAAQVWRQVFGSGKPVQVDVSACIRNVSGKFEAQVRHLKVDYDGEVEFGLEFIKLTDVQRNMLTKAVALFEKYGGGAMPPPAAADVAPPAREAASDPYEQEVPDREREAPRPASKPAAPPPAAAKGGKPVRGAGKSSERLQALARSFWGKDKDSQPSSSDSGRSTGVKLEAKSSSQSGRFQAVVAWFTGGGSAQASVPTAQNFRGMKVGEILLRLTKIKPQQMMAAHDKARSEGKKFGRYLLDNKMISPAELCRALSLQSGVPIVDLSSVKLTEEVASLLPYDKLVEYELIPFNVVNNVLYVAATSPLTKKRQLELEQTCGKTIKVFLAQDDVIINMLETS